MRLNEELLRSLPILVGAMLLPTPVNAALEQMFLYFPDRTMITTPATMRLAYEDVFFSAEDGTQLHGWYLPGEPGKPVLVFCHGNEVLPSHLSLPHTAEAVAEVEDSIAQDSVPSGLTLGELEKRYILRTLAECNGNRTRAAAILDIGRNTLVRKRPYQIE